MAAVALGVLGAGLLLVYSGLRGVSVVAAFQAALSGQPLPSSGAGGTIPAPGTPGVPATPNQPGYTPSPQRQAQYGTTPDVPNLQGPYIPSGPRLNQYG